MIHHIVRECRRTRRLLRQLPLCHFSKETMKRTASAKDMHSKLLDTEYLLHPSTNPDWQVVTPTMVKHYTQPPPEWANTLDALQTQWDWRFDNVVHLQSALTHFSRFHPASLNYFPSNRAANRSLEFLGDSILSACVAIYLFQAYPLVQEGQMTIFRSSLVKNDVLARVAGHLKLPDAVLLGSSIKARYEHDENMQTTIHASAVEALIGAVLLDQGMDRAIEFTNTRILPVAIDLAKATLTGWNPTGEFIERMAAQGIPVRFERHQDSCHSLTRRITLYVDGAPVMTESGNNNFKKLQKTISERALKKLGVRPSSKHV
ncbi:Aste57867_8817 [Aphanomyces stellatus]|uniref:Aste57867_8817 protein n=1 Tax=Aphanomyces stellatus TaxID=120398 RepID=A0A485KLF8_9STRA|nr:hypothetical protein As57867_008782 [Aphanomyces stellatus]VFT85703.1 Aste57867_8817 [Aphanomyces stellatus]